MLSGFAASRRSLLAAVMAALAAPGGARAQGGHSAPTMESGQDDGDAKPRTAEAFAKLPPEEKWRRRFPQPVLVADLIGRKVLDSKQGVLGFVEAVVAGPDGTLHLAFRRRRLLAFRGDTVVVPNIRAALLGPFVMLPEISDDEIGRLPTYEPARFAAVNPDMRIRMALTKH